MRFKSLDQWLDWQAGLHPSAIELGLQRVASVWRKLSPSGLSCPVVTVAGTNGKGSCVAMLDSICRQAGYRVGTYTSPHLVRYNERIKLNGIAVDEQRICEAFDAIDKAREEVTLTYFEFGTLAALYLFAQSKLDLVILEVGLGGRLDAVNIIDADLSLITTIDLDHQGWLGETREAIGREKAGIMRSHKPVVLADPEMPDSLFEEAERVGAEVLLAGRDYQWRETAEGWSWRAAGEGAEMSLPLPPLRGAGQLQNAAAVVMACQRLRPQLEFSHSALSSGLEAVQLAGRLQLLPGRPQVLLDVAHNRQAIAGLLESLGRTAPSAKVLAVFGLLHDKNASAVAELMKERVKAWYLTDLSGDRERSAESLAQELRSAGVATPIYTHTHAVDAFRSARASAQEEDLILVFGSFIVVGDVMRHLGML